MAPPEPAPAETEPLTVSAQSSELSTSDVPGAHSSASHSATSSSDAAPSAPRHIDTSTLLTSDPSAKSLVPGALWSQLLASDVKRSLKTLITKLNPISLSPGLAILEVPADLIEIAKTNQRELELLIASISGKRTTIEFREQGVTRAATSAPLPGFTEAAPPAAAITDHPVVKRAAELFNARVISVQPRRRAAANAPASTPVPAPTASPTIPSSGPSGGSDESGSESEPSSGDND